MFLEPSFFLLNASFASFTRRSRLCMACSILCFSWTDWSVLRWYQPYATPNTRAEYRTTLVNQAISIHPKRSETGNVHSRWAKPWFKYSELFCGQTALRRISAVAYVITRNLLIKVIHWFFMIRRRSCNDVPRRDTSTERTGSRRRI